jgi:DNA-binding CsgD family transcriptional regulator
LAFAERARRELQATGESARRRAVATRVELTALEAQIARLAATACPTRRSAPGFSCLRARSSIHLGNVFPKLEITSRSEFQRNPPRDLDAAALR